MEVLVYVMKILTLKMKYVVMKCGELPPKQGTQMFVINSQTEVCVKISTQKKKILKLSKETHESFIKILSVVVVG